MSERYIIGIDEVGRGPIAGPVAVCAFKCERDFFETSMIDTPLRDSKQLTKLQREAWFAHLKEQKALGKCDFAVSLVAATHIDSHGISKAIKAALTRSLMKLSLDAASVEIYLDGGLKAPKTYTYQQTIIKGDELHPVISCASIIAKVSRDTLMARYAETYPQYGFDTHVGYGTKAHYEAVKKHGLTVLHRKSFLKNVLQDR